MSSTSSSHAYYGTPPPLPSRVVRLSSGQLREVLGGPVAAADGGVAVDQLGLRGHQEGHRADHEGFHAKGVQRL